jgi:hypothetical protein
VEKLTRGVDRERGGLLLVEGAEALHAGAAAGAEGNVLADESDHVGRLAELGDRLVTDAAGHGGLHLDAL